VEIKKIIFCCVAMLFLNGCFQSTAMVGPAISLVSSGGNIYQAGLTYGANKAVENETGMTTPEYVSTIIEEANEKKQKKKLNKKLFIIVKSNFEKTRKIILSNPKTVNQ
tara:strand:- start:1824 stop:2150 length:327 start_codon:yes stop_codon:yes gene_type:complete